MPRVMPQIDRLSAGRRRGCLFSYLSAAMLLHLVTATEGALILAVLEWSDTHPLQYPATAFGCLAAVFTQLDARSRYQEFKKAADQLLRRGPDIRIFRSLSGSRCQRDAVLEAARQAGCAAACRTHFADAGYRWYHLLPDNVVRDPGQVVSLRFLRTTFFAPTYRRPPLRSPEALPTGARGSA